MLQSCKVVMLQCCKVELTLQATLQANIACNIAYNIASNFKLGYVRMHAPTDAQMDKWEGIN